MIYIQTNIGNAQRYNTRIGGTSPWISTIAITRKVKAHYEMITIRMWLKIVYSTLVRLLKGVNCSNWAYGD